jgi:hypothetical protein
MSGALVDDRHVFEISADELRPRVAGALRRAFGDDVEEIEPGWWRARTTMQGIEHTITMRVLERGREAEVVVDVASRRPASTTATLAGVTVLTVLSWIATAALTFSDFRGHQDPTRLVAWIAGIAGSLGLTLFLRHYAATRQVNAMGALAPLDRFWKELESVEAGPRIARGYRIAPELAAAEEAEEAEAEAEAEEMETKGRA